METSTDKRREELYEDEDTRTIFLIFRVESQLFAISTEYVTEMVVLPKVVNVPDKGAWARGVIKLRGNTFSLIDFRKRIGLQAVDQQMNELIKTLNARKEEHKNWIRELENSVHQDREFTLAVSPHECAFGKWYDNYSSNNAVVNMELKKFDEPHKLCHHTAVEVEELKKQGKQEEALELIEAREQGVFKRMEELFGNLITVLQDTNRELAVLIEFQGVTPFAITVDHVESVEVLRQIDSRNAQLFSKTSKTLRGEVMQRSKTDELVYLVQPPWILSEENSDSPSSGAKAAAETVTAADA